jgi:hypothetical protein
VNEGCLKSVAFFISIPYGAIEREFSKALSEAVKVHSVVGESQTPSSSYFSAKKVI